MLVNNCMKFHEDILNGFKVTERTQFCLRSCYLQSSRGHNSKSLNTRVMVLVFCTSSNVGKYLYEVSWRYFERFLSYRADTTISQNLLFSISKGHNSKNMQSIVTVLAFCTSYHVALHLCKDSWKYLKRFLSYRADTILWQTDRWTDDQGQNNMSPNPTGGDIILKWTQGVVYKVNVILWLCKRPTVRKMNYISLIIEMEHNKTSKMRSTCASPQSIHLLSIWIFESLATHTASDQTGRLRRLTWVCVGHTCQFVSLVMLQLNL